MTATHTTLQTKTPVIVTDAFNAFTHKVSEKLRHNARFCAITDVACLHDLSLHLYGNPNAIALLDVDFISEVHPCPLTAIRHQHPNVKIILTSYYFNPQCVQYIKQGLANGYFLKPKCDIDFHPAIKTVHNDSPFFGTGILETYTMAHTKKLPIQKDFFEKQLQVFNLIVRGIPKEEVKEIMKISLSTVNAHLRALYKKTGCKNEVQLTNFAHCTGRLTVNLLITEKLSGINNNL